MTGDVVDTAGCLAALLTRVEAEARELDAIELAGEVAAWRRRLSPNRWEQTPDGRWLVYDEDGEPESLFDTEAEAVSFAALLASRAEYDATLDHPALVPNGATEEGLAAAVEALAVEHEQHADRYAHIDRWHLSDRQAEAMHRSFARQLRGLAGGER